MKTGKLRNKILAFVLPLTLIPFVLTALAVYYFVIRSYQNQIAEEQNKLLAQAIVDIRREQEATRRDVALIARLPAIAEYLEAVSSRPQTSDLGLQTSGFRPTEPIQIKEAEARASLRLFFDQNPYYLQLSLIDAQGQERVKFSKLPEPQLLKSLTSEDFFKRALIGRNLIPEVQMPVESAQPGHFTSIFTHRVQRERLAGFAGVAVLHLNAVVFERHLRPLLASHHLSTFLFDDRGLIFTKSFAGAEEESCLNQVNLAAEAKALLTQPALVISHREVRGSNRHYLFSTLPAEESITFLEPVAGDSWFLGVLRPKGVMPDETQAFQMIFFLILLGALGAVIWATARYARRFTRPLEQMAEATTKIARGQFEINLGITTGDEVEELASAVKQMADDLKQYQVELIRSAKLASLGEMASELSHEIQNRISGLSLWIQYLDAEMEPDDPKREYLEEMKQGLRGFISLLADLKQFYRTPILQLSDTDLNELVRESLQYIEQQVEDRKIEVELRLDPALPAFQYDADKLNSVILNLLLNAVEAVGDQGRILVQTRASDFRPQTSDFRPQAEMPEGKAVIFSVTDNGSGIAEEDLPRIFYPFYSTKAGGSGLGLAIAANLVSAHGGKIEVESRVGQGTTFTVTLQTTDLRLQTTDFRLQTSDLRN